MLALSDQDLMSLRQWAACEARAWCVGNFAFEEVELQAERLLHFALDGSFDNTPETVAAEPAEVWR
jgi:hypothetical protein